MNNYKTVLNNYLMAWKDGKPRKARKYTTLTYRNRTRKGSIDYLKNMKINDYKIIEIEEYTKCVRDAKVNVTFQNDKNDETLGIKIRLVQEKEPYQPSINGVWGVNPISGLKLYPKWKEKKEKKNDKKSKSK